MFIVILSETLVLNELINGYFEVFSVLVYDIANIYRCDPHKHSSLVASRKNV